MKPQILALVMAAALVSGCGGGGDDSNMPTDPKPQDNAQHEIPQVYRDRLSTVKSSEFTFAIGQNVAVDTTLNGHTLTSLANNRLKMNMHSLPRGWLSATGTNVFHDGSGDRLPTQIRSYQSLYSGSYIQKGNEGISLHVTYGVEPLIADMPTSGKASYSGVAFDASDRGTFNYHLDFGSRSGHGEISGLSRFGRVTLHPTTFSHKPQDDFVIFETTNGRASSEKRGFLQYTANVWGPGGQELNGKLQEAGSATAVFQGTRGAVTK